MKQEKYLTFDEFYDLFEDSELYHKYYQFRKEHKNSDESNSEFYSRKIEYINDVFVPKFDKKFVPIEIKFSNEIELNNCVEQIINELDEYGRNEDCCEYGLPFTNLDTENMKQIVTNILTKYETTPNI